MMRTTSLLLLSILLILAATPLLAQVVTDGEGRIGIGTLVPDKSAILTLESTRGGLLLPRLSEAQRDALVNPPEGLLIYNTTTNKIDYNFGSAERPKWGEVVTTESLDETAWLLEGNAGLVDSATNFLGTLDDTPVRFIAGGEGDTARVRMTLTPRGRLGIGTATPSTPLDVVGRVNTSAAYRIGGRSALTMHADYESMTVGVGRSTSPNNSVTAVGYNAGGGGVGGHPILPTGQIPSHSTLVGANAGSGILDAVGHENEGIANTIVGSNAGAGIVFGRRNTIVGAFASGSGVGGGLKDSTTVVGYRALAQNSAGTVVGAKAVARGSNDVALGAYAETGADGGSFGEQNKNTALGSYARTLETTNSTAIGYRAEVRTSNSIVLGSVAGINGASVSTNVGIGAPGAHRSAVLDLVSSSRGLLVPRLFETQRDNVQFPATGLLIYNRTTNSFDYFNGTEWTGLGGNSNNDSWLLSGNSGTSPGIDFIGTVDDQAFEVHVGDSLSDGTDGRGRVVRYVPGTQSPTIVAGYQGNIVEAENGAAVLAGGQQGITQVVEEGADYSTIGGGAGNRIYSRSILVNVGGSLEYQVSDSSRYATIAGGFRNALAGDYATVGGGAQNRVEGEYSGVLAGEENRVTSALSAGAMIGGDHSVIAGGAENVVEEGSYAAIAGGESNRVEGGGSHSSIGGGENNRVNAIASVIAGGESNQTSGKWSGIGSGTENQIDAGAVGSRIGGGEGNRVEAQARHSVISGGSSNSVEESGSGSVIGGGARNTIEATQGVVDVNGGSEVRTIDSSLYSTIAGGVQNRVRGSYSVIPGGHGLTLNATGSFGFLGNNTGTNNMSVSTPNTALFGNTDLWLANNDGKASALRLYEAQSTSGDFPAVGTNYSALRAGNQTENITYILPDSSGIPGDLLKVQSVSGTEVQLDWSKSVALAESAWLLSGNAGTAPGTNFIGTLDSASFEIHVSESVSNGLDGRGRVVSYAPGTQSPTIVAGFQGNVVDAQNGGAILAGGKSGGQQRINEGGDYSVIAGGAGNSVDGHHSSILSGSNNQLNSYQTPGGKIASDYSVISGGAENAVDGSSYVSIVGGESNRVEDNGSHSSIGGGHSNRIDASSAVVGGGEGNSVESGAEHSVISGGTTNRTAGEFSGIGSGSENEVEEGAFAARIGGGEGNQIEAGSTHSLIAGGEDNRVRENGRHATIGGGAENEVTGNYSTVAGGLQNSVEGDYSGVLSGEKNRIWSFQSPFGEVRGDRTVIAGGADNSVDGSDFVAIAGGRLNRVGADADYTAIPGGRGLTLSGSSSFGYLGGNADGSKNMTVAAPNTSLFGNTDLWLANNDGEASALRLYEAQSTSGDFPAAGTNYSGLRAGNQTADITYILPDSAGSPGDQLEVLSVSGAEVQLDWSAPATMDAWLLEGNAGTTPGVNYVGTSDSTALHLAVHGGADNSLILNVNGSLQRDTGGDARGLEAVDLQINRNFSYEVASGNHAVIGGGDRNQASGRSSTVGGGTDNEASGLISTIGGGLSNRATNNYAKVGGGSYNEASGDHSTIGGGNSNVASGHRTAIGGGVANQASGLLSTIGGGVSNHASGELSTIVGGLLNEASGKYSTVGGYDNEATGIATTIGGGIGNQASGESSAIGGGFRNEVNGMYSTVGGGRFNEARGEHSWVGGGSFNTAFGDYSTVAGGRLNNARDHSSVGGGELNSVFGGYSSIGGGSRNRVQIGSDYAVVSGGSNNTVNGQFSSIPGGSGLTLNAANSFGFLSNGTGANNMTVSDSNTALFGNTDLWLANNNGKASTLRFYESESAAGPFPAATTNYTGMVARSQSTDITWHLPDSAGAAGDFLRVTSVSGSEITLDWDTLEVVISSGNVSWDLVGNAGTTAGTNFLGTTDDEPFEIHVDAGGFAADNTEGRGRVARFEPNDFGPNVVLGFHGNQVESGHVASTVGGGGIDGSANTVAESGATVAGGFGNRVEGGSGVISGGTDNLVKGYNSTIAGGEENETDGANAAVGGGKRNLVVGKESTISGGIGNQINGAQSAIPGGSSLKLGASSFGFNAAGGTTTDLSSYSSISYFGNTDLWLGNTNNAASALRFYAPNSDTNYDDGAGGPHYSAFQAGPQSASITYTLPLALGATSDPYVLTDLNGTGTLGWRRVDDLVSLPEGWALQGNSGTTPGADFLGTRDDVAFEIHVADSLSTFNNGRGRALRIEPTATSPNIIGGYKGNEVNTGVVGAVISGGGLDGSNNLIEVGADYGVIAGGRGNNAEGEASAIGGGHGNLASGKYSVVAGGGEETAAAALKDEKGVVSLILGIDGEGNRAEGDYSAVGGGRRNIATGSYSAIPGGRNLTVGANSFGYSAGTTLQTDLTPHSNISYFGNTDLWIGNVDGNARQLRFYEGNTDLDYVNPNPLIANYSAFTARDQRFNMIYELPIINGNSGYALTINSVTLGPGDPATADRTIALQWTDFSDKAWQLEGNSGTSAGDDYLGTSDNEPFEIHVYRDAYDALPAIGAGRVMRFEPGYASPNIIGGHNSNSVKPGAFGATISGGGASGSSNRVDSTGGTIGGGVGNVVEGQIGTVGGGTGNLVNSRAATVGGGQDNIASGSASTVGGGFANEAGGRFAAIPGGRGLKVGSYSFGFNGDDDPFRATDLSTNQQVAYFGNVDVWIGNVDTAARELRFYTPNSDPSLATGFYSAFKAGAQKIPAITYTLPITPPSYPGGVLRASTAGPSPSLEWGSPDTYHHTNRTANYTMTEVNSIVGISQSTAAITVTLPATTNLDVGKTVIIKDEAGNAGTFTITVVPDNGATESIDGNFNAAIKANYGALRLYYGGGGKWFSY